VDAYLPSAVLRSVLAVPGVAAAEIRPDRRSDGAGTLFLGFQEGVDRLAVADAIDRRLREEFRLMVDPVRLSAPTAVARAKLTPVLEFPSGGLAGVSTGFAPPPQPSPPGPDRAEGTAGDAAETADAASAAEAAADAPKATGNTATGNPVVRQDPAPSADRDGRAVGSAHDLADVDGREAATGNPARPAPLSQMPPAEARQAGARRGRPAEEPSGRSPETPSPPRPGDRGQGPSSTPTPGSASAQAPHHVPGRAAGQAPAPAPAPARAAAGGVPPADPSRAGCPRLLIERVVLETAGLTVRATVTLSASGASYAGTGTGSTAATGVNRSVAVATLAAVQAATGDRTAFDVDQVEVVRRGGGRTVLAVVVMTTAAGNEVLTGAAMVREDVHQAVIKASLDAVNRRIGPFLG
jgi:hypothetical protein